MSLLKSIIEAQGGNILKQIAGNFGLDASQATSAIGHLLPALTKSIKKNTQSDNGLEGLLGAIKNGNHGRYLDDPSLFGKREAADEGNNILGHILGTKQRSREVAAEASEKSGIDASILKKLLPMVAAMTMGGLNKQSQSSSSGLGGLLGSLAKGSLGSQRKSSGIDNILGGLLDTDKDGSILDDVMGMAKKFF